MSSPSKVSVLVVEDVEEMRHLLKEVLQKMEAFSLSGLASNGAEMALELTRRRPDLVLMDEVLPGESGLDLLEQLKSQGIPSILITSLTARTAKLPEGALARICKPSWKSLESDRRRMEFEMIDAMRRIK